MLRLKELDDKIVEFQKLNDHLLKGSGGFDKNIERSTQYSASIGKKPHSTDEFGTFESGKKLAYI